MTTATTQDRLRQIAILVSSVDAATGRQLLLHLPTETAKQVRAMASRLGTITHEEKRQILAEFQRSATSPGRAQASPSTPAASSLSSANSIAFESSSARASEPGLGDRDEGSQGRELRGIEFDLQKSSSAASWTRLSTATLVHFVSAERPAVAAVVISQLAPLVAVEVLRQLRPEVSNEVLQRLCHLQDIDPEAMAAIDEHLSERLNQYQHHMDSELENNRRIKALLAAAPEGLRQQWSQLLNVPLPSMPNASALDGAPSQAVTTVASSAIVEDLLDLADSGSSAVATHRSSVGISAAEIVSRRSQPDSTRPTDSDSGEQADILPFGSQTTATTGFDRSLRQLEFEQILQLPHHLLATLLSATDSETVILALAGASPDFIKSFYGKLDRSDARALQARLQRIGSIQLRDIDEAQRRIVENAVKLAHGRLSLAKAA